MFEGLMERIRPEQTEPKAIVPQQEAPRLQTESETRIRAAEHELVAARRKLDDIQREYQTTRKSYPPNPLQELVMQHIEKAKNDVIKWETKVREVKTNSAEHKDN